MYGNYNLIVGKASKMSDLLTIVTSNLSKQSKACRMRDSNTEPELLGSLLECTITTNTNSRLLVLVVIVHSNST